MRKDTGTQSVLAYSLAPLGVQVVAGQERRLRWYRGTAQEGPHVPGRESGSVPEGDGEPLKGE